MRRTEPMLTGHKVISRIRKEMRESGTGAFAVCATGDPRDPFGLLVAATLGVMNLLGDPSRGFDGAEGVLVHLAFTREKLQALRSDCSELLGDDPYADGVEGGLGLALSALRTAGYAEADSLIDSIRPKRTKA